jgi:transcriptional regulator with XRE-family HTH domain
MAAESRTPRSGATDVALGERIRRRRRELGLSQSALGGKLGITFQQVQKYENGANRVSASMLVKLSDALAMPVMQLLHDVDPAASPDDSESDAAHLMAAFGKIRSPEMRAAILTLIAGLVSR